MKGRCIDFRAVPCFGIIRMENGMLEKDIACYPVVALRGLTLLPDMIAHFDISKEYSAKAVEEAMRTKEKLFLITRREDSENEWSLDALYSTGVLAEIKEVLRLPNKALRIMVAVEAAGKLVELHEKDGYYCGSVRGLEPEENVNEIEEAALVQTLKELFQQYALTQPKLGKELVKRLGRNECLYTQIYEMASNLPLYYTDKQMILEADSVKAKYEILAAIFSKEIQISRYKQDLQTKIKTQVDKSQREYMLREQMKVIRKELGEDTYISDADRYMEQLTECKMPNSVVEKIKNEIKRLKMFGANHSETAVIQNYIETMLAMPWSKTTKENKDLKKAEKILEQDHYGMKEVKERVLEYLAVRKLAGKGNSPILCLVGAPGTGKTSIGKSIARALDKKYIRISLGGVHDEAEIRGHRKTYIGAMPGRIATGLKQAGVKNPLMLLDEIDKVGENHRGDPYSALLEVLDSEQNKKFRDHYLEEPLDLSEVMFVATANTLQGIPKPLIDRMEIIEVSGYTQNEKLHIVKEHLLSKQRKKHGLKEGQLIVSDHAIEKIIECYTREAGVRNLERRIADICRKSVKEILVDDKKHVKVTASNMEKYLGKEKYRKDKINEQAEIGIVRGLAWTSVGGDTLEIEVNTMSGKGEVQLTGQLGDVMKESAMAGISYLHSASAELGIPAEYFKKHDIHIHIPEGAVPKDGPSAGITMATAVLSTVVGRPVPADIAMTGEITLRGRVLPVGGLKEKLLAAKNAGVRKVFVPADNRKDIEEISKEITGGLDIVYVTRFDQVWHELFKEQI